MAFQHGKDTYVSLDGDDLSAYVDSSDFEQSADVSKLTTYGKDSHVYGGGTKDATFKMSGTYDNTAGTGPRAVIQPLIGTTVELVRRIEGTGSGLPQDTVDVVVKKYTESSPAADYVKWTCECQCSDDVDSTAQSA